MKYGYDLSFCHSWRVREQSLCPAYAHQHSFNTLPVVTNYWDRVLIVRMAIAVVHLHNITTR